MLAVFIFLGVMSILSLVGAEVERSRPARLKAKRLRHQAELSDLEDLVNDPDTYNPYDPHYQKLVERLQQLRGGALPVRLPRATALPRRIGPALDTIEITTDFGAIHRVARPSVRRNAKR